MATPTDPAAAPDAAPAPAPAPAAAPAPGVAGVPAELQLLLDERAIAKLMTDYTRFVDFGEAGRIAELFTEDGVWDGPGVRLVGRAELVRFFGEREAVARRTSRHVITNIAIDVFDAAEAAALSYLINYRHDSRGEPTLPVPADHPKYVGEYHDRFVRTALGWRFVERRFTNTFLRARSG